VDVVLLLCMVRTVELGVMAGQTFGYKQAHHLYYGALLKDEELGNCTFPQSHSRAQTLRTMYNAKQIAARR
jgi:hypothetical protein